jgi:penicillin-binding protein 2
VNLYEGKAQGNIVRFETLSASRGLVVDRAGRPLAENRVAWSVSVIPSQLPDDPVQLRQEREQIISALQLKDLLAVRRAGLPLGSEDLVLQSLASEVGIDPDQLTRQVRRSVDNLTVVKDDLSPDDAARFREIQRQLPGVAVLNRLDYYLELHAGEPVPTVIAKDVPRDVALSIQANTLFLPGVVVSDQTLVRQYPGGPEFSHILGYVGPISKEEYEAAGSRHDDNPYLPSDAVGRGGLEEAMEPYLKGTHGGRWIQTDARGVEVAELEGRRLDPKPGNSIELTIDRDFQKAVTAALRRGIQTANDDAVAHGKEPVGAGAAVAVDPQTGEVLALVSLPNFDNQLFVDGISQPQYQALLDNPLKPLTNLAVSGAFPPGSTIKPLLACAGLHAGTITPNTQYRCLGSIRVPTVDNEAGGNTYVCWNPAGHGPINLRNALAQSCDVYFYNVGAPKQTPEGGTESLHYYDPGDPKPHYFEGLGIERIEDAFRTQFGFGAPTGIELAAESPGLVPNAKWLFQTLREYWSVGDTINVSIGQGHLDCTPLQLTCAIAAIANGGRYYRPRLVRALRDIDGNVVREFGADQRWQLTIDPGHVGVVREGMRLTVSEGTAKGKFKLTGDDIPIAGKTGTAEYGEAVDGKYKKQHAWFTAFAPYDAPRIAVAVVIQGGGEGATFAVPVVDEILAHFFGKPVPQA